MFEHSKPKSLCEVSVTRIGDPLSYSFLQTVWVQTQKSDWWIVKRFLLFERETNLILNFHGRKIVSSNTKVNYCEKNCIDLHKIDSS